MGKKWDKPQDRHKTETQSLGSMAFFMKDFIEPEKEEQPEEERPHAPYNFVPFNRKVFPDSADDRLNLISDSLYSGEICYKVTAKTPILVDSGKGSFYRIKDNICALPGSTMRGLIRSNLQILGFAGFKDDIDDYNLMYRAVASGALYDSYTEILGQEQEAKKTILKNVKAGYLKRSGDEYTLYQNVLDSDTTNSGKANYFVVSERCDVIGENEDNFKDILDKIHYKRGTVFVPSGNSYEGSRGDKDYNENYEPYYERITYSLDVTNHRKVTGIKIGDESGLEYKGFALSTGKMKRKKVFFVIPEVDELNKVDVSDSQMKDAVKSFQIDYNRRKNTLSNKDFYDLPKDGETRPVFYIMLDKNEEQDKEKRLYFGYTPHLRLMFKHTILDGLIHQQEGVTDFSKKMFGYSLKRDGLTESHKSRLFFTDAEIINQAEELETREVILAEPKPTSYLEYLYQEDGKTLTYNDDGFRLRGTKQYWLRNNVVRCDVDPSKKNVTSEIKPINKNCTFQGSIRFQNLSVLELGLLIWSVRLEKESKMNLGKAKAYGYGQIKVDSVEVSLQNHPEAYKLELDGLMSVQMKKLSEEDEDAFVKAYKVSLAAWIKGEKQTATSETEYHVPIYDKKTQKWASDILKKNPSLRDFFYMKEYVDLKRDPMRQYMSLDEFSKYKDADKALPTVNEYSRRDKNREG